MADNHFEDDQAKVLSAIKAAQQQNTVAQVSMLKQATTADDNLVTVCLLGEILGYGRSVLEMNDLGAHFLAHIEEKF